MNISNRLKELFEYVGKSYGVIISEWNSDEDHIHCLFKAKPNTNISKFLNSYKSLSSRLIKKKIPTNKKTAMEGALLVTIILSYRGRWSHDRSH